MPRLLELLTRSKYRKAAANYRLTFEGPVGEAVLADLADFCCVYRPTYTEDEKLMHMREGRREVFTRIAAMLQLDVEDYGRLMGTLVQQARDDDG